MKKLIFCLAAAIMLISAGCRSNQNVSSTYAAYHFGTTCMNDNLDGTYDLRAFGTGNNKASATAQAMKNAVNAVIFNGFEFGGKTIYPVLNEMNAREKYSEYFNRFFSNNGPYRNFVREKSSKDSSRIKSDNNSRENYGMILVVDRAALQRQLKNDHILP
ncbi:MAG: hypothetical protein K2N03_03460 [Muribaculaceae bacterium]|nr:hypothetical protein [Muribaculaceae bacterium]